MESLRPEVAPFGIHTTIVNPGFFRTELLTPESTNYAAPSIDDYAERRDRPDRRMDRPERQAVGRPGQARPGAHRRSPTRSRHAAGSSPAPTRSAPPSRRSPSCRPTSTSTASASSRSTSRSDRHASWTNDNLAKIGDAEELAIASRRPDGTLRPFVTIWVVRVDGDLYVRSAAGPDAPGSAERSAAGEGRIRAGGIEQDVAFEVAGPRSMPRHRGLPCEVRPLRPEYRRDRGLGGGRRFDPAAGATSRLADGRLGGRHPAQTALPLPTRHDLALAWRLPLCTRSRSRRDTGRRDALREGSCGLNDVLRDDLSRAHLCAIDPVRGVGGPGRNAPGLLGRCGC